MSASVATQFSLPFGTTKEPASRLVESLGDVCAELPLEEKVFLAPSLAIGHQTVERLARSGRPWMHLRVETLRSLAHALVGPDLARKGKRLLSRAQALALVEQACAEVLKETSYFGLLRDRPGLHRALQRAFDELRAAGISAGSIPKRAFADARKHRELTAVLTRYEATLERGGFVDEAGVLRRAGDRPRRDGGTLYLLPEGLDLSGVERSFLEKLAGGRLRLLPVDPPEEWRRAAREIEISRATGEENEIRAVLRRVTTEGIFFDEVELLHTDSSLYPALVWEIAAEHGVPCTFAEGIRVTFTRPGRAALAFLSWISADFEAERLREALAAGVLQLRGLEPGDGAPSASAVARALRKAQIGWGRRRHRTCLDKLVAELSEPEAARQREEGPFERIRREERRRRNLAAAKLARAFTERAANLALEGRAAGDPGAIARGCRLFIQEFARVASELDGTALAALTRLFSEFEALPAAPVGLPDAVARLADAVRNLSVASDRPRPGRLHVAHFRSGGFSGRPHTFLLGLDDARHPGSDVEDPVLLDAERREMNRALAPRELSLSGDRRLETARSLEACLGRLRGRVRASYSDFDLTNLVQPGKRFPAPVLLDLFRERPGRGEADYAALDAALPRTDGFIPEEKEALDETEWWLARIRQANGRRGELAPIVGAFFPHLAEGRRAEERRDSDRFTEWDGWVRAEAGELDPRVNRQPMSCSRIETLASCPYRFFLRHVLHVEPPEDLERDSTAWLDPMKTGSLLHEVFRAFLEEITAAGERPSFDRHAARLEEIAEREIAVWREKVPPRSDAAFAARRDEILFACRTFLRLDEDHCREAIPRFFEVPFGLPRAATAASIASEEPVEIPLGGGRSFLLRGCMDRVDEAPDGTFAVWDYKTGSSLGLREEMGLRGGRQVQYALYALALEALLARAGTPRRVTRSGYFFPGKKGQGQRFAMPLEETETREVLNGLFDLLAEGAFPHALDKEDCRFCDYQSVCGGVERAAERAAAKAHEVAPPVLRQFWERNGRAR